MIDHSYFFRLFTKIWHSHLISRRLKDHVSFPWITAVIENFELPTLPPCFLDSNPQVLILASRFLFFRLVLTAAALSVEGKTGLVFCWVVRCSHRIRFNSTFLKKIGDSPKKVPLKLHLPGVCVPSSLNSLSHSLHILWQMGVEWLHWKDWCFGETSSGMWPQCRWVAQSSLLQVMEPGVSFTVLAWVIH